ncbi:MAG: hypothetical protein GF308_06480 [Candidatus Heimdallarchaeota archaeon]|nr:hypothetical protein [Candidatus Heimdallarchaeota archaeon]
METQEMDSNKKEIKGAEIELQQKNSMWDRQAKKFWIIIISIIILGIIWILCLLDVIFPVTFFAILPLYVLAIVGLIVIGFFNIAQIIFLILALRHFQKLKDYKMEGNVGNLKAIAQGTRESFSFSGPEFFVLTFGLAYDSRECAIAALSTIPTKNAEEALLSLYKYDDSKVTQEFAAEALISQAQRYGISELDEFIRFMENRRK